MTRPSWRDEWPSALTWLRASFWKLNRGTLIAVRTIGFRVMKRERRGYASHDKTAHDKTSVMN